MNKNLLFLFVIPVFLTGCSKYLYPEDRLVGAWRLDYAERYRPFHTSTIETGYEEGTFYFYENGQAEFVDRFGVMKGSWQLRSRQDGYYDNNGQYVSSSHQVFHLHLINFQDNSVLDWDFDDSWFAGRNRFKARYETPGSYYTYVFARL